MRAPTNICRIPLSKTGMVKCLHTVRQQCIILLDNKELHERNGGKKSHLRSGLDSSYSGKAAWHQVFVRSQERKQESAVVLHRTTCQDRRDDTRRNYRKAQQKISSGKLNSSAFAVVRPLSIELVAAKQRVVPYY